MLALCRERYHLNYLTTLFTVVSHGSMVHSFIVPLAEKFLSLITTTPKSLRSFMYFRPAPWLNLVFLIRVCFDLYILYICTFVYLYIVCGPSPLRSCTYI